MNDSFTDSMLIALSELMSLTESLSYVPFKCCMSFVEFCACCTSPCSRWRSDRDSRLVNAVWTPAAREKESYGSWPDPVREDVDYWADRMNPRHWWWWLRDLLEYWWRCSRCPRAAGRAAVVSESAADTQMNTTGRVCESRVHRSRVFERSSWLKRPCCWNTFGFRLTDTFLSSSDEIVRESVNHSTCTSQRPNGQTLRGSGFGSGAWDHSESHKNTNNKHEALWNLKTRVFCFNGLIKPQFNLN